MESLELTFTEVQGTNYVKVLYKPLLGYVNCIYSYIFHKESSIN